MYTLDKFHKHVLRIVLLLALATSLVGCFDLSGQEVTHQVNTSPLKTSEAMGQVFESPRVSHPHLLFYRPLRCLHLASHPRPRRPLR
jgi:hypothetical protein